MHTSPAHQRRGAGSMMLSWGIEQAKAKNLLLYLEASPEGRRLYQKFGFLVEKVHSVDLSKWGGPAKSDTPIMTRQPNI